MTFPARSYNDMANALNNFWLRNGFYQGTELGWAAFWFIDGGVYTCCNTKLGKVGDMGLGYNQQQINLWWDRFNAGNECGVYGYELLLNTPSQVITPAGYNCGGTPYSKTDHIWVSDEGLFRAIHPSEMSGNFTGTLFNEEIMEVISRVTGTIRFIDMKYLKHIPTGLAISEAYLRVTVNTMPAWRKRYFWDLKKNGVVQDSGSWQENNPAGTLGVVCVGYQELLLKESMPGESHPCPNQVRKYIEIVGGVEGIAIDETGTYDIDITPIMQSLLGRDPKWRYGFIISTSLPELLATQNSKASMFDLRNRTFNCPVRTWWDGSCEYWAERGTAENPITWEWIEGGSVDFDNIFFHICRDSLPERALIYGNVPEGIS